ncbi:MAG: TIGR00730 family Rossman fold protein [Candidatus Zambryskibacteria bacterium CG_4_9_14_3_um_filter_40_16]|uniref:Cytokinin riboside 5'-monophosphate phosphoribohydrolase n=2 Tax=Candidatus Zambryskiibacteriota TaxID=1817925 RepID=A0A2H0K994_9BACT|nr:MAG: TIGR00730 family Rossman fold protein [Candidatus Zambryskibacteria bacterium CG11_big_fil_rev_8_21_14_0_20_40_24]PJA33844.1 MAG: TIGR00730 family Rossman fold protein [Candidatus Zambryskibacteria bacterium CG_4_9_14_3_um_filter_40_16]
MEKNKIVCLPQKDLNIKPLTHEEIHTAARERVYEISREFTQGFRFLEKYTHSVTFFGSAQLKEGDEYYDKARELAKRIVSELSYTVISGGGPGIMEAANRGAKEAGGNSVGLTIRLPREQVMNDYMTDHIDFYYFFSRKVCLTYSAEAFIFFPGGFGTLDEFFEVVTLLQTHKIPNIPVILFGTEYWGKLFEYLKETVRAKRMIDDDDMAIPHITDDFEEAIRVIKDAPVRKALPYNGLKINPVD